MFDLFFISKFLTFDDCFNKAISCQDYFSNLTDLNTSLFSKNVIRESSVLNVHNGYNIFSSTDLNFGLNFVEKGYVPAINIISDTFNGTYVKLDRPISYPDIFATFDSIIDSLNGLNLIEYNSNYVNFNCKFSFVGDISFYSLSNNVITSPGIFNITIEILSQQVDDPGSEVIVFSFTNLINSTEPETQAPAELCIYIFIFFNFKLSKKLIEY